MAEYNPFADQGYDDIDLSAIFGEEKPAPAQSPPSPAEPPKSKTVGEILDGMGDDGQVVKKAFSDLATQIDALSSRSNISKEDLAEVLRGISSRQEQPPLRQEDLEEQNNRNEVKALLRELGLEDDGKATLFVTALDKLADRRANRVIQPYVKSVSQKFAQDERAEISRLYPEKGPDGKDTGYPTLDSCVREVTAFLNNHPSHTIREAYEWVNRSKLWGSQQGGEVKASPRGNGLTGEDVLRKIGISGDKPSSSTTSSVNKTGQAKTIREAMAQAAQQLGVSGLGE